MNPKEINSKKSILKYVINNQKMKMKKETLKAGKEENVLPIEKQLFK